MIVGRDFVYVQMQKTGCTSIAEILQRATDAVFVGPKHAPLVKKQANKIIIGSIRSPFAWYVSLWAFRSSRDKKVAPALYKRHPFWGKFYADPFDKSLFRSWLREIYNRPNDLGDGYRKFRLRRGVGLMTFRYCRLYNPLYASACCLEELVAIDRRYNVVDRWLYLEKLEEGLETIFSIIRHKRCNVNRLCRGIRRNKTRHVHYRECYDEKSARLIEEHEGLILRKHGYSLSGMNE